MAEVYEKATLGFILVCWRGFSSPGVRFGLTGLSGHINPYVRIKWTLCLVCRLKPWHLVVSYIKTNINETPDAATRDLAGSALCSYCKVIPV